MLIADKRYGYLDMIRIPFRVAGLHCSLIIAYAVISALIPTFQVIVIADFIDSVVRIVQGLAPIQAVYLPIVFLCLILLFNNLFSLFINFVQVRFINVLRVKLRSEFVEKIAKLKYRYLENQETMNVIARVSNPEYHFQKIFNDLISYFSLIVRVSGLLVILFSKIWWLTLLVVAISIPLFWLALKSGRANYQANKSVTRLTRDYTYLGNILISREALDERTLFGFGKEINKRWLNKYETARKTQIKTEKKWFIKMKSSGVFTALICITVLFSLLIPVMNGQISVGLFISLVTVTFDLIQAMSWELMGIVDQIAINREFLRDLTTFGQMETVQEDTDSPKMIPQFKKVEFRNVRFHYPTSEHYVLDGVSFIIELGKHYSFVGSNGSGKTTITKLMLGLYDSFEGEILINDIPIGNYTQNELKAFYSVVFQDYARYSISIRENVLLGNINKLNTSAKDCDAEIMAAFSYLHMEGDPLFTKEKLDTVLGKIDSEGIDISGGQWQKVALARALLNPAPVRILDEPTASLDPMTESDIYKNFVKISQGVTSIFISHRLASTQFSNEIFVIDHGKIVEQGSHEQLMDLQGLYWEMYETQKGWYV